MGAERAPQPRGPETRIPVPARPGPPCGALGQNAGLLRPCRFSGRNVTGAEFGSLLLLLLSRFSRVRSSDCRAKRPHLGWCPEANVPLQGRQVSRGCIPDAPGETGIHLEWKLRTSLCSRVATGISGSSLCGLKGVKPPEAFIYSVM